MFFIPLLLSIVASFNFQYWIFTISVLFILYCLNYYRTLKWKKLGIPYLTPIPVFGTDFKFALGLKTRQDLQRVNYERFGDNKFGGLFSLTGPTLFIKDPDLIEHIFIKDFNHFTDRSMPLNEKKDPLVAHLFNMTGKRWKGLRNKLSPMFTSGKLKTMHQQLIECADILIDVLDTSAATDNAVDFKETMSKFTTDVIGSCAYGLNMNSLKDPDSEFRKMGRRVFEINLKTKLRFFLRQIIRRIHPNLIYILGLPFIPKDINDFFINLVHSTIKMREENPKYNRNDFIQLLMNLRSKDSNDKKHLSNGTASSNISETSDEVIVDENIMAANSFLFFVAGFETTASTLSYCLFELAHHPEIQQELYAEITDVLKKHEGQPTYDAIKNLPFMDMVISETLRKYPPVPTLPRICTENYVIPETNVVIPKGCRLEIPVYSLHHDPNIYPDPEKFNPSRFKPDVKDSIPKGAYLPFGDGPRICIGARFAQMEIKVCLCKILSRYKILKNPSMADTIEFDAKSSFLLIPKTSIIMNVVKR